MEQESQKNADDVVEDVPDEERPEHDAFDVSHLGKEQRCDKDKRHDESHITDPSQLSSLMRLRNLVWEKVQDHGSPTGIAAPTSTKEQRSEDLSHSIVDGGCFKNSGEQVIPEALDLHVLSSDETKEDQHVEAHQKLGEMSGIFPMVDEEREPQSKGTSDVGEVEEIEEVPFGQGEGDGHCFEKSQKYNGKTIFLHGVFLTFDFPLYHRFPFYCRGITRILLSTSATMGEMCYPCSMAKLITGIVAHVDAGKTTLSEALLYTSGAIRKLGRVDSGDAFLDTNSIERKRGITIFAKEATLSDHITLIDTPGHVDFSAEMERSLSVLDAAILLINATDGIQAHTKTLWSLLKRFQIPTLLFVNKMDMPDTNRESILQSLKDTFSEGIIDFGDMNAETFLEEIAGTDDELTEKYLSGEELKKEDLQRTIAERKVFPVIFGSALRLQGIECLLNLLEIYFSPKRVDEEFGAIVYKLSVDKQNNRLTHLKITGGVLHAKDPLGEEKANEIRIYSGEKFETVKEVQAGEICTVTGLKDSKPGTVYGSCHISFRPQMEPALIYAVQPPEGTDPSLMLRILQTLEDEMPELKVRYQTEEKEFQIMLMGEVQTEVIKELIWNRHHLEISFGDGRIAYKETIRESVIGVGHYEPLKHYAEVHLLLKPLARNRGMVFRSNLPVNDLDTNWQRLILTHLEEKQHLGVLTGSPITDMEISVLAGKAHLKHTEGGDFRQSTYRAIRQGLMKAESVLLEPFYRYEIVVPDENVGRVMSDMERMHGTSTIEESKAGFTTLTGQCPVSTMKNYINDVRAFTRGQGTLSVLVEGYDLCHNSEDVIKEIGYNPDADLENPASSVFCSHGAGFVVPWQEVDAYKHIILK